MSLPTITPVSTGTLDAIYTARNIAQAIGFAVTAPARRQQEKDVRAEDEAINAALRAQKVAATAAALTSRRRENDHDGQKRKKRNGTFATFENILDEEQPSSFDSYA